MLLGFFFFFFFWVILNSLHMPINSSLNVAFSHCKNKVKGEFMDFRSIRCVCDFPKD